MEKEVRGICAVENVHNFQYFAQFIANANNQKLLEHKMNKNAWERNSFRISMKKTYEKHLRNFFFVFAFAKMSIASEKSRVQRRKKKENLIEMK